MNKNLLYYIFYIKVIYNYMRSNSFICYKFLIFIIAYVNFFNNFIFF
jgi:hypothetical protein